MKLGLNERLLLLSILPEKGNLVTLRIVSEMRNDLALKEDEVKNWNVRVIGDGQVAWGWTDEEHKADPTLAATDMTAEINMEGERTAQVVTALKELDAKGELTVQHISLCDKFPFGSKTD